MQTKTSKNSNAKPTPDLMGGLTGRKPRKRRSSMPKGPTPTRTASQIADSFEAEAKKMQSLADILRGKS